MTAGLDIEFEDEDEGNPRSRIQDSEALDVSLEFSATTEIINLVALKEEPSSENVQVEISEEMKAIVDKVKSENAQVRSLSEARQKKPAAIVSRPSPTVSATPAPQVAIQKSVSLNEHSLSEKLDPYTKVQLEAEIRVAKAETKGETMAFYLSEMKLLEYQVMTLIRRLGVKTPEGQKVIEQIQRQFAIVTKKKP